MGKFISALRQLSRYDATECDDVIGKTEIPGLYWIRTYRIRTAERSGIVLQNPGQENVSIVYHAGDFTASTHGGYDVYGIHLGQSDVLTFLATDDRTMLAHFVDCRAGSPTLRREVKLELRGDPDRALVIDRGIAHIFDGLVGMVTLNQPRLYWDFNNGDFSASIDVLNVARETALADFPAVRVNRFRAPAWMCRLSRKAQRLQLRAGQNQEHPFRFRVGEQQVTFVPRRLSSSA